MSDSNPDTSQQRAAVDPEARDSLIHRVQVTQLLRIGSALGVGVLVAALTLWSTVQAQSARIDALAARVTQTEAARETMAHDVQALREAMADVRADTRVTRAQVELVARGELDGGWRPWRERVHGHGPARQEVREVAPQQEAHHARDPEDPRTHQRE
mgnify:CR=1 FL=1